MKKLTLVILIAIFCMLIPIATFAQDTSRLVAVRLVGGQCGALVTFEVDYHSSGGAHRVEIRLVGPGGILLTDIRRINGNPHNGTAVFQLNSNGYVVGGAVLRVQVGMDGEWRSYFFDCGNFELAQQSTTAYPNFFLNLNRHSTYDLNVIANDSSQVPISRVNIITQPPAGSGSAVLAEDGLSIRLTTGNRIGSFTFTYQACNFANNCGNSTVTFSTINAVPSCDAVSDTLYFWARDVVTAPFIGSDGVEDPDGDNLSVQITSLTSEGSGPGGTIYVIEFTVTDTPPAPGIPLTCSGTARVQKEG